MMNAATLYVSGIPDSFLQRCWDYLREREEFIFSPYLPALFAFLTHVLLCAPFLVLDALGYICRRIQSYKRFDDRLMRQWMDCFWRVLFKYISTVLPATAILQTLRGVRIPDLAPSCIQLFIEVVACLLLFDFLFFVWHYSMHRVPWLYKQVHRAHHRYQTPIALAAQDASSAEMLSLLVLALVSAWVVGCHPLSELVFHLFNSWLAVEDHCGYDLPWSLHRVLPCLGGAPFHQAHHHLYKGNYAPYFTHWDKLCGTYIREYTAEETSAGGEDTAVVQG